MNINQLPSPSNSNEQKEKIDYEKLWQFFQDDEDRTNEIEASNSNVFMGPVPNRDPDSKDGPKNWVQINGPDEYPYQYCKKKEDLPGWVSDFFVEGGTIEDINKAIGK